MIFLIMSRRKNHDQCYLKSLNKIESIDNKTIIKIMDSNDYQVLHDTINSNSDIPLTNDKDFDDM